MIVAFTGTHHHGGMTSKQQHEVRELLQMLNKEEPIEQAHHGDCIGSDANFHDIIVSMGIVPHVHPMIPSHKRAYCFAQNMVLYPEIPPLLRNRQMVDLSSVLIATPKDYVMPKNLRGQGTWSTVSYALKKKKRVLVVLPNGVIV